MFILKPVLNHAAIRGMQGWWASLGAALLFMSALRLDAMKSPAPPLFYRFCNFPILAHPAVQKSLDFASQKSQKI